MKINREMVESIGSGVFLLGRTIRQLGALPNQLKRVLEQCHYIGYMTFPLVFVLSFAIGAVVALQTGYSLRQYGILETVGTILGLSMVRELGPVMTAIMLAGRVGSSITAEISSMKVYQEIDALKTMSIPPERILVMPRLVAVLLVMPLLTVTSVIAGWLGGAMVVHLDNGILLDYGIYFRTLREAVTTEALFDGLMKGQVFGFVVILICCNIGLRTTGGPREIGQAVTRAVVASIIAILVLDYFVTKALL